MASISGVGEFFGGPSEEDDALSEKYRPWMWLDSGMYPINPVQFDYPMAARPIELLKTTGIRSEFLVDGLIRVYAPSDAFRQSMVDAWSHQRTLLNRVTWLGLGGCALGGMATVATAPVYFIGTIAAICFTGFAHYRTSQADTQIKLWKASPAAAIAEQRAIAYKEGFPHVYANQLKLPYASSSETALLHPTEVQMFYEKYFPAFCNKMLDWDVDYNCSSATKEKWMVAFLKDNPLEAAWMQYAYGLNQVPEHLTLISRDFARMKSYLDDIRSQYKTAREQALSEANKAIQQVRLRNSSLRFSGHYVDGGEHRIREMRDAELQRLQDMEATSLANCYPTARELMQRARDVWDSRFYPPPAYNQYMHFEGPQFNVPPPPMEWQGIDRSRMAAG